MVLNLSSHIISKLLKEQCSVIIHPRDMWLFAIKGQREETPVMADLTITAQKHGLHFYFSDLWFVVSHIPELLHHFSLPSQRVLAGLDELLQNVSLHIISTKCPFLSLKVSASYRLMLSSKLSLQDTASF